MKIKTMNIFNHLKFIIIFFFLLISICDINAQSDWEYNASIYGWFAGIDGTVGVAVLEQQVDATPSDLLKIFSLLWADILKQEIQP
jgi:hypothetical protein